MLYNSIDDLPLFVKRLKPKQRKKWMEIYNETFRTSASETDARTAANSALELSVKWGDLRTLAEEKKRFPICEWATSDVFSDWDPSGVYVVQVMRTGLWRDHPEFGDIHITKADLAEAVKNFRVAARKPFLDEEHGITRPEWSSRPGENFGVMSDMWIEDLDGKRLEPAEAVASEEKVLVLRGQYEVNAEANEWLKNKSKMFYSPTFVSVYYNKETGEFQGMTIFGGAMTNVPYIDGMDGYTMVASANWPLAHAMAEMYPKSSFRVSRPEGMTNEMAISELSKMGFEITSAEYWEFWVVSPEGGELAEKMGQLEKAGFSVSCFYQGAKSYETSATLKEEMPREDDKVVITTTAPILEWHETRLPWWSR